jgi:hypothetical protein
MQGVHIRFGMAGASANGLDLYKAAMRSGMLVFQVRRRRPAATGRSNAYQRLGHFVVKRRTLQPISRAMVRKP